MDPLPIIIDCDPGQDDAIALLLALASPEALDVRAVTAVAGNVPLALTERNARRVVTLAGRREVPVHAGCARPIAGHLETAEHVHGESGLDGAELPEPAMETAPSHAVDAIIAHAEASRRPITLATLGPLTNVAVALVKAPEISARIARIVLMGGAVGAGNVTPSAEFNIHADPEAADVVFSSGIALVMLGLDVTHQALATPARIDAIRALGTAPAAAVAGMLEFYRARNAERFGLAGAPLHDPCVIAYLVAPDIFEGRDMFVAIERHGALTRGRTVCDVWGTTGRAPNARVVERLDAERFFALLIERLSRLPG